MLQTSDSAVIQRALFGGHDGTEFDDLRALGWSKQNPLKVGNPISKIVVRSGNVVDALNVTYNLSDGNSTTIDHGGPGGSPHDVVLGADEVITSVYGKAGLDETFKTTLVAQIGFVIKNTRTADTRIAGPFGNENHKNYGTYFEASGLLAFGGYHDTKAKRGGINGLSFYSPQAWA